MSMIRRVVIVLALAGLFAKVLADTLPSSYPHVYSNQPSTDLGPDWQSYFEVTESLPNVTFDVSRSFAGNIAVQREGHPNNTLFFWAFEKEEGSLTADTNGTSTEPWGIWLNGGPGSSSMYGLLFGNGPINIGGDYSASRNNYTWANVADYVWIDQPVGVGFATADADGYVADENQVGEDFMGFLENFVKVFPSLATRPLYITGESYAGTYIPYIMKTYFSMSKPPVNLAGIGIGNGAITSGQVFELLPALDTIQTYPQLIGYDPEVYEYFEEQSNLCGYDVNLTYPQGGIIPSVPLILPTDRDVIFLLSEMRMRSFKSQLFSKLSGRADEVNTLTRRDQAARGEEWKRDLTGRANGTIDSWYGCLLLDEFIDYALNFTYPWNITQGFNVYDIPDALNPEVTTDGTVFLNDNQTRAALHAPTSKDWALSIDYTFGQNGSADPSPEPMVFLTELATNATAQNITIVLYSGNDDSLIAHRGTEIAIQNTTFGGIQGFTKKPSTPWYDESGAFAGIVHQERGWKYVLVNGAGHLVTTDAPEAAFLLARDFILGNNETGLVDGDRVVGGEDSALAVDVLPGGDEIYYGAGTTQSTYIFPSATRSAWEAFIQTATAAAGVTLESQNGGQGLYQLESTSRFGWAVSIITILCWML
ncbi:Alpha/Beta hydrolase protein [Desarmillaria tabescens]|uniref:Carboxypeptidase n=1 Tax=Armillaria tabescens TaxID=1929756 RepID=A0AA39TUT4_ARMTA|nr:Alpha/Beta hydrolase protein [Desarmillaria tabescens]KAK0467098.1 Alpha/Beta hydrolase protein [Desarmillaria tabescens]